MTQLAPEELASSLDEVWPSVHLRLRALLAARGAAEADDIIQEVALRVLEHNVAFSNAADLIPWAATVARNLDVSGVRERRRVIPVDTVPQEPAPDDVAESVHWREVWVTALTRIAQMPSSDQGVLLDGLTATVAASAPEAVKTSVRRHRARAKLRGSLHHLLTGLIPVGVWWRVARRQTGAVALSATLSAALLIAAGVGSAPAGPARSPGSAFGDATAVAPAARVVAQLPAPAAARALSTRRRDVQLAPRDSRDRHVIVQPTNAPGLRVDEAHAHDSRPLLCLHGPVVDGTCTPTLRDTPPPL